jgi:signal transduction histidine kinase/CheY-like chemotaxis protein
VSVIISALVLAVPLASLAAAGAYFFSLKKLSKAFNLKGSVLNIEQELKQYLSRSERLRAVAMGVDVEGSQAKQNIGGELQRIISRAGAELRAKSVELTLFDSESGLAAQSFVVGAPGNALSRGSVERGEVGQDSKVVKQEVNGIVVLYCPVRFARQTFGDLQFEFAEHTKLTSEDESLVLLFARQVAIAVLDTQFTGELLRMRRLSDESVRAKTGFLANLSHELRGPLGIILNGSELALDGLCGPISDQVRDTLKMIKGNGEHLLELVNDVLDYAKVEAGKIVTKPVEIALKPLLTDLFKIAQGQAEQKNHKLTLEPVDETLGTICDRRHLRQMIINLITNAIKYTPDGGKIVMSAGFMTGGKIKITVADTGVGIPLDQRHKVFGAFERVDHSYSEKQAGSGLGMPLTRKLAEANGGMIDFESDLGTGSKFWIILPSTRVSREQPKNDQVVREKRGRGESLVIIDSEQQSRELLGRFLEEEKYKVFSLGSPREVIKLFKETEVQGAILDSNVTGMSLEELIVALRAHPKGASIPIIITTPSAFSFDVESYLKLGVDRCISKPINYDEVSNAVRQLLDEYSPRATIGN